MADTRWLTGSTAASAPTEVGLRMTGAAELMQALEELPKAMSRRIVEKALKAAAKPVIADARARARKVSRGLAAAITHKMARRKVDWMRLLVLGPKKVEGLRDERGRHKDYRLLSHLLEGGTTEHVINARKPGETYAKAGREKKKAMDAAAIASGAKPWWQRNLGPMTGFEIEFSASVKHPGFAGRPFMRPAFDSKGQTAIDEFMKKALESIEIEAAKLAARSEAKVKGQ